MSISTYNHITLNNRNNKVGPNIHIPINQFLFVFHQNILKKYIFSSRKLTITPFYERQNLIKMTHEYSFDS